MESLGIGEWIVIGLSVVIGLFFFIGNWYNNQRCTTALAWLRRGMASFGEVKSARLSAPTNTGIRLKIDPSDASPFQSIAGNLVLERRENLPLWAFQSLRGKHDQLQLQADLCTAPAGELHIFHKSNLALVNAAKKGEKASFTFLKQAGDFHFYTRGEVSPDQVDCAAALVSQLPATILEFSLQRKSPHLALNARLSPLLRSDPKQFFQILNQATNR
jgi:hypothetical protein